MTVYPFDGRHPKLHPSAFVAPGAFVIGDVELGPDVSVWHGAVLRGDDGPIRIGPRANIQDMTMIHVVAPTIIGANVTIGHRVVLHGVTIEDDAMVGIGAILLDGVHVEKGAIVAAGSVVSPGKRVLANHLWAGVPARFAREVRPEEHEFIRTNAAHYVELAAKHRAALEGR
jgi:carbonic anhydrase/acetyltransferase-like protein (isoleucine patch superfamily)